MSWPRPGTSAGASSGSTGFRGTLGRSRSTRHLAPRRDDHRLSRDDLDLLGPRRTQTVHTPAEAPGEMPIIIGMALGSPAREPAVLRTMHADWPSPSPVESAALPTAAAGTPMRSTSSTASAAPATVTTAITSSGSSSGGSVQGGGGGGGPIQRSKTTRRKLFGLFGGGSSSSSSNSPTGITTATKSGAAAASTTGNAAGPAATSTAAPTATTISTADRLVSRSGTVKKHQPIVIRIESEPEPETEPVRQPVAQESRGGPPRPFLRPNNTDRTGPLRPLGMASGTMNSRSPSGGGAPSFLDHVEIPDIHMERYSVMFGSLLHPGRGGSRSIGNNSSSSSSDCASAGVSSAASAASASSLLARRQATLDRLRMINGRADEVEGATLAAAAAAGAPHRMLGSGGGLQRRATSPSTATSRSPSTYSLFPSRSPSAPGTGGLRPALAMALTPEDEGADCSRTAAILPSPRFRSNTSPATTTISTSLFATDPRWRRQQQQQQQQQQQTQMQMQPPNPLRENPIDMGSGSSSRSMDRWAARTPTVTATEQAVQGFHASPTEKKVGVGEEEVDLEEEGEKEAEDDVQRRTPSTTPFKPVLPEPQWQMVPPPTAAAAPAEDKATKETTTKEAAAADASALSRAVEMSIARQISVSRLQRQMLVPVQRKASTATARATTAQPADAAVSSSSSPPPVSSPPLPVRSATLRLGRHERLQATKTATPTLVVSPPLAAAAAASSSSSLPSAPMSPPSAASPYVYYAGERPSAAATAQPRTQQQQQQRHRLHTHQLAQNRRSERVVLEAA